jgi:uncharacterized protein (DUF2147 family)
MKKVLVLNGAVFVFLLIFQLPAWTAPPYSPHDALWACTVSTGAAESYFRSVVVDTSGSVYAAGYMHGTGTYTFGTGVTANGTFASGFNVLLVKYNSSGTAQWARTVSTGAAESTFFGVAIDKAGNVYAAGRITGTGTYTFGTGVTATGTFASGYNVVLVKYDSSGAAQWARTVSTGAAQSIFSGAAIDTAGNVYAAGCIWGTGTYTFGTGVTATRVNLMYNVLLVKYDSSGAAQWARTVSTGAALSAFDGITVDTAGNVYAAGIIAGTGTFTFGTGVTVAGATLFNVVLVKYDSSGAAQWARTVSTGATISEFYGVAVDTAGNVFAAGRITETGTFTFGTGVTAAGTYASGDNVVLVKYDSSGTAQWATTVIKGASDSQFHGVSVDSSGNVYTAGYIKGKKTYAFGTVVTATGTFASGYNVVLVKYPQ